MKNLFHPLPKIFSNYILPEPNTGCWLWTGCLNTDTGYGRYGRYLAHRVSYVAHTGEILGDRVVHHKCGVRNCVNPDHLESMSAATNNLPENMGSKYRFWAVSKRSISGGGIDDSSKNRLMRKVSKDQRTSCWIWGGGSTTSRGNARYGVMSNKLAHRVSYEIHKGPIPPHLQIDHVCRNTLCVNPDHLEAVTQHENIRRARFSRYGNNCEKGHELTDENTWVEKNGCRHCRKCHAATEARRRARNFQRINTQ
jgi:hypothetical protein